MICCPQRDRWRWSAVPAPGSKTLQQCDERRAHAPGYAHRFVDAEQLPNSGGAQDLIVHILARGQRYETANYPNVAIPTNLDVKDGVRNDFGAFNAALFDRTLSRQPKAVVTDLVSFVAKDDNETKIDSGPLVPAPAMCAAAPDTTPAPNAGASSPPDKGISAPPSTPPQGGCAGCRVGDADQPTAPMGAAFAMAIACIVTRLRRRYFARLTKIRFLCWRRIRPGFSPYVSPVGER